MRILDITEITTTPGIFQTTVIPLDKRPGVYFRILSNTFKTPHFTANVQTVPVQLLHSDRAVDNVTIEIKNGVCEMNQKYRLASSLFLVAEVNDDWADVDEVSPVYVDSRTVKKIIVNLDSSTADVIDVAATYTNGQTPIQLKTVYYTPNTSIVYTHEIETEDGNRYICPLTFSRIQTGANPNTYDLMYANVPLVLTAYKAT